MTAAPGTGGQGRAAELAVVREAAVRRRRRPGLWVAGVVVVAVGALVAAAAVGVVGDRVPVLAVARTVHMGQTLTDADVAVAHVAADPALRPVPATERGRVVGKVAAVELRPGSLLTAAQVTGVLVPGAGEQLVGVPVRPGQLPARGLVPGDRVLAVPTAAAEAGAAGAAGGQAAEEAAGPVPGRVMEVGEMDGDGTVTVDLLVDARVGPVLAAWASAGRVALLLLPAGG